MMTKTIYGLVCFIIMSERGEKEVKIVSWCCIPMVKAQNQTLQGLTYQPHKYHSDLVLFLEETGVTKLLTTRNGLLI